MSTWPDRSLASAIGCLMLFYYASSPQCSRLLALDVRLRLALWTSSEKGRSLSLTRPERSLISFGPRPGIGGRIVRIVFLKMRSETCASDALR
jgi:hypothetical protein